MNAYLAMWLPQGGEWIVIGMIALLIFGRRLPDVARSVGKSIVEFKKGIRDVKGDVDVRSQIDSAANAKLEGPAPAPPVQSPTTAEPTPPASAPPATEPPKESSPTS